MALRFSTAFFLFTISLFCSAHAQPLTESQAVRQALEQSPDLISARVTYDKQKSVYRSARDELSLQAEIWAPYRKIWTQNFAAKEQIEWDETGLNASLSRLFRWGGRAAIEAGTNYALSEADSQSWSAAVNLSQPLLKGAGKYAPADVDLYRTKNDLEASRQQLANEWSAGISSVRQAYWDWIARAALIRIRERQMEYAQKELLWQKARFKLGDASEVDTMSAGLKLLEAQSSHASALQAEKTARRFLADLLQCKAGDIIEPENPSIQVPPIAPYETVLAQTESVSTDLRILALERKSLERQLGYAHNRLLPSLNATAFAERSGTNRSGPLWENMGVGAELRFDLFSRKARTDANRTRLDLALNQLRREKAGRSIRSGLEDLYDSWHSDSLRYDLAVRQWELSQRLYQAIQQEERLGATDTQTRQKALDDLTQFEIEKLTKQLELKRLEIVLDKMTLGGFTKFGVTLP